MTTPNPSNYSREDQSTPYLYVRYRGVCVSCTNPVQTTIVQKQTTKHESEWVRCNDCGQITTVPRSGSENHHGGTA